MGRDIKNVGKGRGYYQKNKRREDEENYNKNPKKCKYCNSLISYEKKVNNFCNQSCACSYNNQGIVRNKNGSNGRGVSKHRNECLNCRNLTTNIKYCSALCRTQYERKMIIDEIEKRGVVPSNKSGEIKIGAKRYLIEKKGRKCEKCNNTEWIGFLIPIEFHHKDGNPDNNKEMNIQILCSNCHSLTRNSRGRNRNGNGRWSRKNITRRKRYADGKST